MSNRRRMMQWAWLSAVALIVPPIAAASPTATPQASPVSAEVTQDSQAQPIDLPSSGRELSRDDPYLALDLGKVREDTVIVRERNPVDRAARGVPVLLRRRPAYDPLGLRAGGFTIFPALTISPEYSSNVFREPDGVSDVGVIGRAEVVARSNWAVHQLILDGFVQTEQFAAQGSQNATTYRARAAGRLDVDRSSFINGTVSRQRIVQDRGGVGEVLSPLELTRFDQTGASVSGRVALGSLWGEVGGGIDHFDYALQNDSSGPNQDFRDYDRYQLTGTLGYQVSPDHSLFISARQEWRRFPVRATPRRDANVTEVLAGINGVITPLIRGRVALGYLGTNFTDSAVSDRSGLAFDVELTYLFAELTTVRVEAHRTLRNVASATSAGAIGTTILIGADHELFRNVILSPAINYETASYSNTGAFARSIGPELTARWLVNPRLRANLDLRYRDRNGRGFSTDRNYAALNLAVGVTAQF